MPGDAGDPLHIQSSRLLSAQSSEAQRNAEAFESLREGVFLVAGHDSDALPERRKSLSLYKQGLCGMAASGRVVRVAALMNRGSSVSGGMPIWTARSS